MEPQHRTWDLEGSKGGHGTKKLKREWPAKITIALVFVIFLGAALLLGGVSNLHMTGYFGGGTGTLFSNSCQVATSIHDFQQSRTVFGRGADVISHNLTDEDLLFMASMEPRRTPAEMHITKKVAFLFLVKGHIHFEPIWNSFFKGHEDLYSVYVHASPDYAPVHERSSVFYGRYIPSQVSCSL